MNGNTLVEMTPKVEPDAAEPKLIVGLIPVDFTEALNIAWKIIFPGLEELAASGSDDFSPFGVRVGMYNKAYWIYLLYMDHTGQATEEQFQKVFSEKLNTPEKDYVGFAVVEPFRQKGDGMEAHIFAGYVAPKYRTTNAHLLGLEYIESQMKKLNHTAITLCTRPNVMLAFKSMGYKSTTMNYRKSI
jgi:hypothetical protein